MITENNIKSFKKGLPKRLTIGNETKTYDSYFVPIEFLYYNDLNGRIATYIEEYSDNHSEDISALLSVDKEKYNNIIAEFIKKSANDNYASFEATKKDIEKKSQKEQGVILDDGRVIDGNRRFTAIRELYKETGDLRFAYFEAVILPTPDNDDKAGWMEIKSLELNLQFNNDEKRPYNKIDLLVSFYHDVMDEKTKTFGENQYCHASGFKSAEISKFKKIVEVMLDYLNWRGKPRAFYILKNEKLDGQLEEIASLKSKLTEDEWNEKKDALYQAMSLIDGDRTRVIRPLVKSLKSDGKLFEIYETKICKTNSLSKIAKAIEVLDKPAETPEDTKEKLEKIVAAREEITKSLTESNYEYQIEKEEHKNQKEALDVLNSIKKLTVSINRLDATQVENKYEFIAEIEVLLSKLDGFKSELNKKC